MARKRSPVGFPRWRLSLLTMASAATLVLLVADWGSAGTANAGGSSTAQSARKQNVNARARPSNPRVSGPRKTTNQSPVYRFSARERGVPSTAIHFHCAVDSAPLHACGRRYHANLTVGSHVLAVLAVDRKGRKSQLVRVRITITKRLGQGAQVVAKIQLPASVDPQWIAADASSVYVHSPSQVVRVSTASNTIVAQIPTPPFQYGYMASGAGAVWEADFDADTLLRIDPSTNKVIATIDLPNAGPSGVAIADGSVWVAEHELGTVVRIDPATNAIVATVTVGPAGNNGPTDMAGGPTGIWVNVPNANRVVHIDTSTNSVAGSVGESGQPIVDGSSVWVENLNGLDRIDPATAKVIARIITPAPNPEPWGAAGLGSVWVTSYAGLVRVDEASNQSVGLLPNVPKGDLAISDGSVWLAAYEAPTLLRIQPLG